MALPDRTRTGLGGPLRVVMGALCLALAGAAEAQTAMSEERCRAIMSIVAGTIHEYHGQISADLISDLQRKIGADDKCDGPDQYRVWPNTKDRDALNRIRQLIAVWDACKKEPDREGCPKAEKK
jgi:hypothetical protein